MHGLKHESVVPFPDRVMHHAIMNVLEPAFERQFIFHIYACRKERGTHAAARYAFKCAGRSEFFLKLDVRKYFDSIDHTVLKQFLCRIIKDTRCLELLFCVIDSYKINFEGDVRYMDDTVIFGDSIKNLKRVFDEVERFCFPKQNAE